ncbi:MAG: ferrous iron transporter B, partial [Acutalibacteraceae bacterium]|nr:ferrous iron transporter B [Acutalibacteraceae bacterium]
MEKIIALVGNPNCGKTTLFNRLTGSSARVGNWPGVTVEKRSGYYRGIISIVDLPGVYALSSFSPEEKVAFDYITSKKADAVINIVDATCMERSLYLTTQLLEMDIPVIVAVNFMDEAKRRGIKIDISALTEKLGIEVVPVSAVKDKNFDTLINAALKMNKPIFAPVRKYESYQKSALERYNLIEQKFMPHIIVPPKISVTSVVDKIALNKFFALPIFTVIMLFVFYIVFGPVGNILKIAARFLMSVLSNGAEKILIQLGLKSTDFLYLLLLDGVFGGVGEVLCFLPQILLLFLLLSLIEASGYMARAAFLTDGVLRRFSLTGKSVVPLLMGFGCSV